MFLVKLMVSCIVSCKTTTPSIIFRPGKKIVWVGRTGSEMNHKIHNLDEVNRKPTLTWSLISSVLHTLSAAGSGITWTWRCRQNSEFINLHTISGSLHHQIHPSIMSVITIRIGANTRADNPAAIWMNGISSIMIARIRESLAATFARKCSLGRSDMVVVATEPAARKITTHTVKRAKRVLATGGQPLVMTLVSAASTKKMPPEVVNRNTSRLKDPWIDQLTFPIWLVTQ